MFETLTAVVITYVVIVAVLAAADFGLRVAGRFRKK